MTASATSAAFQQDMKPSQTSHAPDVTITFDEKDLKTTAKADSIIAGLKNNRCIVGIQHDQLNGAIIAETPSGGFEIIAADENDYGSIINVLSKNCD